MNEKTFDCAGFSTLNGVVKPRVANGLLKRYKTLERYNHKDIKMIVLPEPMTKAHAVEYVLEHRERVLELADEHLERAIAERDAAKLKRQEERRQAAAEKSTHSGSADDEMHDAFRVDEEAEEVETVEEAELEAV